MPSRSQMVRSCFSADRFSSDVCCSCRNTSCWNGLFVQASIAHRTAFFSKSTVSCFTFWNAEGGSYQTIPLIRFTGADCSWSDGLAGCSCIRQDLVKLVLKFMWTLGCSELIRCIDDTFFKIFWRLAAIVWAGFWEYLLCLQSSSTRFHSGNVDHLPFRSAHFTICASMEMSQ